MKIKSESTFATPHKHSHHKRSFRQKCLMVLLPMLALLISAGFLLGQQVWALNGTYTSSGFRGSYWDGSQQRYYTTVGALGRKMEVITGFSINRTMLAPEHSMARSGQLLTGFTGVTIHETSNWNPSAGAMMHAAYLQAGGKNNEVSWHYSVDSKGAYQSVPEYEKAWHAGDTGMGQGNATTIAIEICDNPDSSFDQAMANAEWLAADILYRHGVYTVNDHLFQHNQFSKEGPNGKNCPITIRDSGRWSEFTSRTQTYLDRMVSQKGIGTPILMTATATVDQAKNWAASKNATAQFIALADLYWELADRSGVNPVVAYAQSAHETGFGRFGGVIDASYCNPCGLKIKDGGDNYDPAAHQKFADWRQGVQAHIDHLALYAGQVGYPKTNTPDPRHFPAIYGTAESVESLGGKWAPAASYGQTVVTYMNQLQQASSNKYSLNASIKKIDVVSYTKGVLTVKITAQNNGVIAWSETNLVRMGFGLNRANLRVKLPKGTTVQPGQSYVFTAKVKITNEKKEYSFVTQVVQENVGWLGKAKSQPISLRSAQIVSMSAPKALLPGQIQTLAVTVKNTGFKTWTTSESFKLSTRSSNTTGSRYAMVKGTKVAPGQTYTFNVKIKTPLKGQSAVVNLQMVQDSGKLYFGDKKTKTIPIKKPTQAEITNIEFSSGTVPGGNFTAQITVKNTDTVTWTAKDSIRLGLKGSVVTKLDLPSGVSVASGQSYTFTYNGKAPKSGDLVITAKMLKTGSGWFGETKTGILKSQDAEIVAVAAPAALIIGQTQDIKVTVKNTGLSTWSLADLYRLSTNNSNTASSRSLLGNSDTVAPGATCTFVVTVNAPAKAGSATVNLQMVQDKVGYFGTKQNLVIPVKKPAAAAITDLKLQGGNTPGSAFTTTVVAKNTDNVVWTSKDNIRLGISGSVGGRVNLPEGVTVAPGQSYSFVFTGTTPAEGNLSIKAQMVADGLCWFGETKTVAPEAMSAEITTIETPPVLLRKQVMEAKVTVKNTGTKAWSAAEGFKLATDNSNTQATRAGISSGVTVAPGESYTFTIRLLAPNTESDATVNLQMVQENVRFFGEKKAIAVPVKKATSAEIISVEPVATIQAGTALQVRVTVKNTDTVAWTKEADIRIGINNTLSGAAVEQAKIPLADNVIVAPGETYIFTYSGQITLPVNARGFDFQMLQKGVGWFGMEKSVDVVASPALVPAPVSPVPASPTPVITEAIPEATAESTTETTGDTTPVATSEVAQETVGQE